MKNSWRTLSLGAAIFGIAGSALLPSTTFAATKTVTLTVATWDSGTALKAYKEGFKVFEKTHPNITINLESIPFNYYEPKLLTQMASGVAPDLMLVGPYQIRPFVASGQLLNLTPLAKSHKYGLDISSYYPRELNNEKVGGRLYLIPKDMANYAVLYNKKLFEAAHVPFPKAGWTLSEFENDAKKLTQTKDGKISTWGVELPGTNMTDGLPWWIAAYGGSIFSPNGGTTKGYLTSPASERAITNYLELYTKYHVSPTPTQVAGFGNIDLFLTGKVAMEIEGPFNLTEYNADRSLSYGAVPMPIGPTGKQTTPFSEAGWGIWANTPNLQAAEELLAFYSSKTWARIDSAFAMPAQNDPAIIASMTKQIPQYRAFFSTIQDVTRIPQLETYNWLQDANTPLTNLIEGFTVKPQNLKQLIAATSQTIDQSLSEIYK